MQKIHAKKYLGQNFLVDKRTIARIIDACELKETDTVLEIGPGTGAITSLISESVKKVIAIEKDESLATKLSEELTNNNIKIINEDVLKYDFAKLGKNIKIISNLPYYIVTPIIEKMLNNSKHFSDIFITVQFEYGQRIVARENTKEYGSFSCFVQYFCEPKILFKIKNTAFTPVPKVQSCFLHLKIKQAQDKKALNEKLFFSIISKAFSQRRKKISNALQGIAKKETLLQALQSTGIKEICRAENISIIKYIKLSDKINELNCKNKT